MRSIHRPACAVLAFAALLFLSACTRQPPVMCDAVRADLDRQARSELAQQTRGKDCSAEFEQRFERFQSRGIAEPNHDLKNYRVLIVHGLLGEVGLKFTKFLDSFDDDQRLVDYMKEQKKALEHDGAETIVLCYKSDSVERCGAEVAQRIRASDRPVLLVSHSKGCLDSLEALLDLQAAGELSKVAGWLSLQGPFAGAPGADNVATNKFRRLGTRVVLKVAGARYAAVSDLTSYTRKPYLETHRGEIVRLAASVPIVSFASLKEDPKKPGSDGAVLADSAVLPGTDFALVRGLSHEETVIRRDGDFDRVAFTRALMSMLLDRVEKLKAQPAANEVTKK